MKSKLAVVPFTLSSVGRISAHAERSNALFHVSTVKEKQEAKGRFLSASAEAEVQHLTTVFDLRLKPGSLTTANDT